MFFFFQIKPILCAVLTAAEKRKQTTTWVLIKRTIKKTFWCDQFLHGKINLSQSIRTHQDYNCFIFKFGVAIEIKVRNHFTWLLFRANDMSRMESHNNRSDSYLRSKWKSFDEHQKRKSKRKRKILWFFCIISLVLITFFFNYGHGLWSLVMKRTQTIRLQFKWNWINFSKWINFWLHRKTNDLFKVKKNTKKWLF